MPMAEEMNRFLMLPNADHITVGAILELLPAINTWVVELLDAQQRLKNMSNGVLSAPTTIEEREEFFSH